jgi:HNH endonuclease
MNRSKQRKEASRIIAFFIEDQGMQWTTLREAVPEAAKMLGITFTRRSDTAIECMKALAACGVAPPEDYCPPWQMGSRIFKRRTKRQTLYLFYESWEWRTARYEFLKGRQRLCACCGSTKKIVVDHIKPIRKHWDLRLDPNNFQLLCDDCNKGKGWRDETDWRHI